MNGLYSSAATVCASAVTAALLSRFISDGGTKKLLGMIMGAFLLCSLLLPLQSALSGISFDQPDFESIAVDATGDDEFNRAVLAQTEGNLEQTAKDLLAQHDITVKQALVTLALKDENRVIIADITLNIKKDEAAHAEEISRIIEDNFSVVPQIITE